MAVNTTALYVSTSGSVTSLIGGTSTTLLQGPVSLGIGTLTGAGVGNLAGSSLTVAGATFTLDSLAMSPSGPSGGPAIEVQGSIALPGGRNVGVDGSNDRRSSMRPGSP